MTNAINLRTGKETTFESVTCSRCGGSGQYSYCQSYGTRCFKCAGAGYQYTKRGAAAAARFNELLSKRTDELAVGDKIYETGIAGFVAAGWQKIEGITKCDDGTFTVGCERVSKQSVAADQVHRVAATREQKQAARDAALAYQATLTKAGTVRKRAKETE